MMQTILENLYQNLAQQNLPKEARAVQDLIKLAIPTPAEQQSRLYQSPEYQKYFFGLLQSLGLTPVIANAVLILNAGAYLKEAITDRNLLLAGFSIISGIPGLEEFIKILQNPNMTPAESLPYAQLLMQQQGRIQGIFNRFKDNKLAPHFRKNIPNGTLLVEYADRIWTALRQWAFLIQNQPAEATQEIEPNLEELDQLAQQL